MSDPLPLEPSAEQNRAVGRAALESVLDFIEKRETAPAVDLEGALDLARSLATPFPESGGSFSEALATFEGAAAKAFDTAGPGYLAYVPGGGLFSAAVADLLACVTNRFVNLAAPAPALVQLESNVVRWLCDLFSFPPEAQGILTSGGSIANLSALITARTAKLPEDFLDGTLYVSGQTHHSIEKAARLAGFPGSAVRTVATTPDLRIDMDALEAAIEADRRAGAVPFLVVGNAGAVNTGTVDPLDRLADLCEREGLWFHVDGAYGGFFQLTERGAERFAGVERADSVTLDPHKGMFLPYGTGSLIVRDGAALRSAHAGDADYLQDLSTEADIPNFADFSAELSRDFRGLRVWLPLMVHGVAAFRSALDEKLDLARHVYDELRDDDRLDVPWAPDLSIVAFAPRSGGNDGARRMLERVNASRRVFLSSTSIDGRIFLRICVLSFRTHRDRIDEAISIVRDAARR